MDFKVKVCDTRLKSRLYVGYGLVVNARADFIKHEAEQTRCCDVPDLFLQMFPKIALDGLDRLLTVFLAEFNGHRCTFTESE